MKRFGATAFLLLTSCTVAFGDDWTGQSIGNRTIPVSVPGLPDLAADNVNNAPSFGNVFPLQATCARAPGPAAPPCAANQIVYYSGGSAPGDQVNILPDASKLYMQILGFAPSSSSPVGLAAVNTSIPLSAFARSSTVDTLAAEVQKQYTSLGVKLNAQQKLSGQGVAQALAMAGTGDIGPDEHYSISGNWGTFDSQNAFAVGGAIRISDHVVGSGGFAASVHGGPVGGRAGFRFGW